MRVPVLFVAASTMLHCGGAQAPAERPQAAATEVVATSSLTVSKSPDSGNVDRIGATDGALTPDGTNDLGFVADTEGPVTAVFVVAVDESGKPSGAFQADTLVGDAASPPELGARPGSGTSGLGVFEGEQLLNAQDGTLRELGAGPHRLSLYIAPAAVLAPGTRLRVYLLRPDKSLVASATITN